MSFTLTGLAVAGGIAIGRAHLVSHATVEVAHQQLAERDVPGELKRLEAAVQAVALEMEELRTEASVAGAPAELAAFVDLHAMILDDPLLMEGARHLVSERHCNAEWALVQQMDAIAAQFDEFDDPYLRERKHDIQQVVERVLKALQGKPRKLSRKKNAARDEDELIIVAHDLSPADTIQFKQMKIGGFVTDLGGATSHTAIVARGLAIPAIVGMQQARPLIQDDDILIIDGTRGVLIVEPDERILDEYRLRRTALELERSKLKRLIKSRATTLDGIDIGLFANIELPDDVEGARAVGADGVGLFRTEFLFMGRDELPDEEEQFEAYRGAVRALAGKPLTIRTLDIGADKEARALSARTERQPPNPALGLRAIRYCLAEPQIFLTQLRAILRAAHHGPVRILVPMLAHEREIKATLQMIEQAKAQLRSSRHKFGDDSPVGGMIEIPAAALALGPFLGHLDFLSIGTNDLIQYTLAIDRSDSTVSHLYDPLHPAVLRLIAHTIETANKHGVPVAVCGEMAGDPEMTKLLLGMGLRQFSMHPAQVLEVKQQVIGADAAQLAQRVARILKSDEAEKIREMVEKL